MTIDIETNENRQVIDITDEVQSNLNGSGLVSLLALHTTSAITLADLDPGTDKDILDAIALLTPDKKWRHPHDPAHFPDHLWSTMIGPSVVLPFSNGKLVLGNWQRIVFIELSGPRKRQIELTIIKS